MHDSDCVKYIPEANRLTHKYTKSLISLVIITSIVYVPMTTKIIVTTYALCMPNCCNMLQSVKHTSVLTSW